MDKLGKQLAQLIRLLEEKVPQGFAELVKEYQYRMIWNLVVLVVFAVILVVVAVISARYAIHNQGNKAKEDFTFISLIILAVSLLLLIFVCIYIMQIGANMVSPSYSLLRQMLGK